MGSTEQVTTFAEATAVKALSSHEYEAFFPDDWGIGTGILSPSMPFFQSVEPRGWYEIVNRSILT